MEITNWMDTIPENENRNIFLSQFLLRYQDLPAERARSVLSLSSVITSLQEDSCYRFRVGSKHLAIPHDTEDLMYDGANSSALWQQRCGTTIRTRAFTLLHHI